MGCLRQEEHAHTLTPRLPGAPHLRVSPANPDVSTSISKRLCRARLRVMAQA